MNKLGKPLIILLFSLFCLTTLHKQGYPANWLYILTSDDKKYYVDTDSIKVDGKAHTIKFWTKKVYPGGTTVSLEFCNYNEKSVITLNINKYDSNGKLINSISPPTEKRYIVPDSVLDIYLSEILKLEGIK